MKFAFHSLDLAAWFDVSGRINLGVRRPSVTQALVSAMNPEQHQSCPICRTEVEHSPRYPRYVCQDCARKALDENSRALEFSNESFSGGFIAKYVDTGEKRDSHVCFIDGVKCWADEAHMGGIVIQAVVN